MTDLAQLYEQDYVAWVETQIAALRELAHSRPNVAIDFEHLIDEVGSLARSDRAAVRSQVARIIEHLLRMDHSDADRPRLGWQRSVLNARMAVASRVTPTIQRELEEHLSDIYESTREAAALGLRDHDEYEAAEALPDSCPYTLDQLLDRDWYPDEA